MKLDISKISNEIIEDIFEEAYLNQIGSKNEIEQIDCNCVREKSNCDEATIEVTVIGMSGVPSIEDYRSGKVIDSNRVVIDREGKTKIFKFQKDQCAQLNSNDYLVVYKSL